MELHLESTLCQKYTVFNRSEANTNCIKEVSLSAVPLMQLQTVRFILIKHSTVNLKYKKCMFLFCRVHCSCASAYFLWYWSQNPVSSIA